MMLVHIRCCISLSNSRSTQPTQQSFDFLAVFLFLFLLRVVRASERDVQGARGYVRARAGVLLIEKRLINTEGAT